MFRERSYRKELLDEDAIPQELLYQNLEELRAINKYLGGHATSLKGLKQVITDPSKTYHVADIGSGGGDSLKAMATWAACNKYHITFTALDIKQDCISFAQDHCEDHPEILFRCDDFMNTFTGTQKADVVHAALFCHHFMEDSLIAFMRLCSDNNAIFVINDLERHPVAWYSIRLLTRLFSKSPLVKNDAPLSVLRGFKKTEWQAMLRQAGIKRYTITNSMAFRHLVIAYPNERADI